jgi:hypothetical protein
VLIVAPKASSAMPLDRQCRKEFERSVADQKPRHPLWSKRFAAPDLDDQSRGTYVAPGADSRSRPKLQAASKSPSEAASFLHEIG